MALIELELIEELFTQAGREEVIGQLKAGMVFVNEEEDGLYDQSVWSIFSETGKPN
jgi:hypothetical protein